MTRKSVKEEIGPGKFFCRKCGSDEIEYYESSGDYEDYHYFCNNPQCKYDWWVDGDDG